MMRRLHTLLVKTIFVFSNQKSVFKQSFFPSRNLRFTALSDAIEPVKSRLFMQMFCQYGRKNVYSLLRQFVMVLASLSLMTACGFHLRGVTEFPFEAIYVNGSETTPLGLALRRNLKAQQHTKLTSEASADVILDILSERPEKVVLSLTVQGFVRESALNSFLTYQVRSRDGGIVVPPTTIVVHRVITYNENVVLSKEVEEAALFKDMQADLVQQIIRRLSMLKIG
ncbi:MAG: rlpB [Solimicrobium sp.]|jgi:LPS-assembly lipoprotein|nr:rlpB [Solimicrobium sp.]